MIGYELQRLRAGLESPFQLSLLDGVENFSVLVEEEGENIAFLRKIVPGEANRSYGVQVARLAGIMAAKRTSELIPLCHPLPLEAVRIEFEILQDNSISIEAEVRTTARTGVEMEALTAVTVAALTIYDMCKSIDRNIRLEEVQLEEKTGGRSGHYLRPSSTEQST